jgi:acyl dehydratase
VNDSQPRLLGTGFYFDELKVGDRFRSLGRTITEADLVAFVNLTWLTEELFSSKVPLVAHELKGRVVPGALVYSFAEGLMKSFMEGTGVAFLGTEIAVKAPTRVDDTIHVEMEIVEARVTSKGDRGVVKAICRVINQNREEVLVHTPVRLMKRRSSGAS